MLPGEDDLPMMAAHHIDATSGEDDLGSAVMPTFGQATATVNANLDPKKPETWGKVSRNEACPCGSGKKYKHCHGTFA